jgi:uncharacterized protein (TIGR02266 family)
MQTDTERRDSPRIAVDLFVEERTGETLYFQRATNLSLGGVFLTNTLPHPPGTRVSLSLRLPGGGAPTIVDGTVVEREPGEVGMAIRFESLSTEAREAIAGALS